MVYVFCIYTHLQYSVYSLVDFMHIFILCSPVLFHWTTTRMAKIWFVHTHDVNGWTIVTDHWYAYGNALQ